jgi:DNA helicase-2/ATP-dependent DNA helicase PcrA
VDLESTFPLFEVFWLRNKDRISNNLMVEKWFTVPIDDFVFKGKIDRVDLLDSSEKYVEILDYKTGKTMQAPKIVQGSSCYMQKVLNICIRNTG